MQPTTYAFSRDDSFAIEKLVDADEVMINHMVLAEGNEIPPHEANSNVHLLVLRGSMRLTLDGEATTHGVGKSLRYRSGRRCTSSTPAPRPWRSSWSRHRPRA